MVVSLTIIRYPKRYVFFALMAMAIHRLPLWLNRNISFYKLMGSGKNGTFDKRPDWQQWAILTVPKVPFIPAAIDDQNAIKMLYGSFIKNWLHFFNCEIWTILLEPIEGHGTWDGKKPFGDLAKSTLYEGPVTVLTRATIRPSKLKAFWSNVPAIASQMPNAKGLLNSLGIGELPFIKQATVSTWESKEAMKLFSYQMKQHKDVIRKTREGNWYSEEMFVRFKPLKTLGTMKGNDPLKGKL
jgi:hypothetical protein